ncbi:MAG: 3-phosphoshikimate 1-carboxyvinyltransferase, partial [Ruminococcus sp.]|nr:3-phosphoshikimate 1-carboxyvinyltransferase [Ruminococcus sp.]
IKKSVAKGTTYAPTSKSVAHRLMICAALADGESEIRAVTFSQDILATLDCIKNMGAEVEVSGSTVRIKGLASPLMNESKHFFCRESGSTLRFFVPILLLSETQQTFSGAGRLMQRPMQVYEDICREKGLVFESGETLKIKGALTSGAFCVKGNISSQFITGLLFALAVADGDSRINIVPPIESRSYINMTIDAMNTFGVKVEWENDCTLLIKGNQKYLPQSLNVEGDYSGSAFLDAFNLLGGDVCVEGMNEKSLQGDMIYRKYFALIESETPTLDVSDCPDLAPILMTLAAARNGAKLIGTKRLKIKESDRGVVMAQELSKFGAEIDVGENEITVHDVKLHTPIELLHGHNDHRIVMSLAVLASVFGGEIDDAQAAAKSFPDFFEKIKNLGVEVEINDD